jgi:DNA-directed RNA polymerase alpha subunit
MRVLYKWQQERMHAEHFPLYEGLSVRARHCLYEAQLRDKESILKAVAENRLKKIRWLGAKVEREIMEWLKVVKIEKVCPTCGGRVIEFRTEKDG